MEYRGVVFVMCCMVVVVVDAQNKYTSKYDNVDVDTILSSQRVLTNYIKCLMDEGPCTADGKELKKTLPDALASGCTKCNERQKASADKVIKHLIKSRNNDWNRLSKKYDPAGAYKHKYEQQFNVKV